MKGPKPKYKIELLEKEITELRQLVNARNSPQGKVTSGLVHLIALSGINKAFDDGRKWLKEFLLFEVSENTVRAETQKMGELQRQADTKLVQETQDESGLQKRERSQQPVPDILYGSIDAAKVRIEPRACCFDLVRFGLAGRDADDLHIQPIRQVRRRNKWLRCGWKSSQGSQS